MNESEHNLAIMRLRRIIIVLTGLTLLVVVTLKVMGNAAFASFPFTYKLPIAIAGAFLILAL